MFSFFKKNKGASGRGTTETRSFNKGIEVLNYVPVDYGFTGVFSSFLSGCEKYFEDTLKRTAVDDQCIDMFEPLINSVCDVQRASCNGQFNDHINTIVHDKGILEGAIAETKVELRYIADDGAELRRELNALEEQRIIINEKEKSE